MPDFPDGDANVSEGNVARLAEWVRGPLLTYIKGLEDGYRAHCQEPQSEGEP